MMYIAICVTLLTLLATLHFMQVNRENLTGIRKLITWLVLLVALGLLICQLARATRSMLHHRRDKGANEMHWNRDGKKMMIKKIRKGSGKEITCEITSDGKMMHGMSDCMGDSSCCTCCSGQGMEMECTHMGSMGMHGGNGCGMMHGGGDGCEMMHGEAGSGMMHGEHHMGGDSMKVRKKVILK